MRRGPGGLMLKALKLTRKASLSEATAVIQKAIRLAVVVNERPAPTARLRKPPAPIVDAQVLERPVSPRPGSPSATRVAAAGAAAPRVRIAPDSVQRGFIDGRHAFAGATRNYKLYVPVRLDASPSLVVMLHGCKQNPDDFAAGTRINERASRDGFLVLYPEQSRSANTSMCWNWFQTNDQQRDHGEAGLIASLTRSVMDQYDVDPTRVYVAGLSAGGAMAANLALAYPDLFAAAAIHSGLVAGAANNVVDALTAMRSGARRRARADKSLAAGRPSTPTIVFHGDDDRTVSPQNGEQIVEAAFDGAVPTADIERGRSDGGRSYARYRYDERNGVARVEHWKLEGAGHAWSGGAAAGSYTDPKGVDATDQMLRFFASHRLEAPVTA